MMRLKCIGFITAAGLAASALLAQAAAQNQPAKPPASDDGQKAPAGESPKGKPPADGGGESASKPTTTNPPHPPAWPEKVNKKLHAQKDLRHKKAPTLSVEKWLTDQPDTKNKVVLVDFWATWCPPCRALIPELNGWQKEFKDDLVIIGVSDEAAAKVESFMKKTKVEYAMAVDTRRGKMKDELGVAGIPHVMVIDSKGVCRWQGFPQDNADRLDAAKLRQIIEADRAQRPGASKGGKD